jgi:hypothetical protein
LTWNIAGEKEANKNKMPSGDEKAFKTDERMLLRLGTLHVLSFWTFVTIDDLKQNCFTFQQGFKTLTCNAGVMNKNVLPSILSDESKPLFVIEPLYFTAGHIFSCCLRLRGKKKDKGTFAIVLF